MSGWRLPGLLVLAGLTGLALLQPVARQPVACLAAWSVACVGWFLASQRSLRHGAAHGRAALGLAVAVALGVRLLALASEPSDDIHRYLWEARVVLAGQSPYALAPDAPELADLAAGDPDQHAVNHPAWSAIYPPVMQWIQAGVVAIHDSVLALKLAWLGAEAALVALLAVRPPLRSTLLLDPARRPY